MAFCLIILRKAIGQLNLGHRRQQPPPPPTAADWPRCHPLMLLARRSVALPACYHSPPNHCRLSQANGRAGQNPRLGSWPGKGSTRLESFQKESRQRNRCRDLVALTNIRAPLLLDVFQCDAGCWRLDSRPLAVRFRDGFNNIGAGYRAIRIQVRCHGLLVGDGNAAREQACRYNGTHTAHDSFHTHFDFMVSLDCLLLLGGFLVKEVGGLVVKVERHP